MKRQYIKPYIIKVSYPDDLLSGLTVASIGSLIKDKNETNKFQCDESFNIVEDKRYETLEEKKFWDDWDNGAD